MNYIEIMYPDLEPSARLRVRIQEKAVYAALASIFLTIASMLILADSSNTFALFKPLLPILMSLALLLATGSLLVAVLSSYLNMILSAITFPIFLIVLKLGEILNFEPMPNTLALSILSLAILGGVFKAYEHEKPGESFWWLPSRLAEIEDRLAFELTAFLERLFFKSER